MPATDVAALLYSEELPLGRRRVSVYTISWPVRASLFQPRSPWRSTRPSGYFYFTHFDLPEASSHSLTSTYPRCPSAAPSQSSAPLCIVCSVL